MPLSLCADLDLKILRLIDAIDDPAMKTQGYLTLEVLYASRRFHGDSVDHVEQMLKNMLENQEVLSAVHRGGASEQE